MNNRFHALWKLAGAASLTAAVLLAAGCQGLAGEPAPPTPTPVLLQVRESATGTVSDAGAGVDFPALQPAPDAMPTAVPGQATPAGGPSSTPTVVPSPAARIMALGRSPSVTLRAAPDGASAVVTTVPGSRVLWAEATSQDGKWLLVTYDDAGNAAWAAAGTLTMLGGSGELAALEGPVTPLPAPSRPTPRKAAPEPALPGKVAFQTSSGGDIYLVNADGSGLRRLTDGMDPALSPDGSKLAFTRWGAPHAVFVLDLQTGEERRVANASQPRGPTWSPDGSRLAFTYTSRSYTCLISPFGCLEESELRARLGGQDCLETPAGRFCIDDLPERIVQDYGLVRVGVDGSGWHDLPAQQTVQGPAWQPGSDEIVYRGDRGLQVTDSDGPTRALVDDISVGSPAWSPDGQRMVVQKTIHDHADLFVLDPAGNELARLTAPASVLERAHNNVAPTWSPDGRTILFLTDRDGAWRFYRMNADGSNQTPFLPSVLRDLSIAYDFAAEHVAAWSR